MLRGNEFRPQAHVAGSRSEYSRPVASQLGGFAFIKTDLSHHSPRHSTQSPVMLARAAPETGDQRQGTTAEIRLYQRNEAGRGAEARF
jgi:hypothetical protein